MELTERPRTECACDVCRSKCEHVPGWFLPGELQAAADLCGLPLPEFFRQHCTVDFWMGDTVFVVRPRLSREFGGEVAGFDPRGTCALLTADKLCGIHAAKPYECSRAHHDGGNDDVHRQVADAWRTPDAQALVRDLLGYEPQAPEPTLADLLLLMMPGGRP